MGILECILYVWYPSLLGWLFNLLAVKLPSVFGIFYFFAPVLLFIGWFWAGKRYRKYIKNPALAILAGNSVGVLSLAVYLWQEYLAADKINWLQQLAQYFSWSLTPLSVGVVAQFSPEIDGVVQVSNTALQCVGFILVALSFTGGYFYEKNREKMAAANHSHP